MAPTPRVLVIRLSSLGDIVLTTPVLTALRRRFPEAEIDYLTRADYAPLLRSDPRLDRLIAWEPASGLAGLTVEIRRRRYDLVLDLHRVPRSILISALSGGKERIGYNKRRRDRADFVRRRRRPDPPISTVRMYLESLEKIGLTGHSPAPELFAGNGGGRSASRRTVGFSPGARWPAKRWPLAHFASLGRRIKAETGLWVAAILSPAETDLAAAMEAWDDGAVDEITRPELADLPSTLARLDLLVSNDSGPMHVATAVGTPVLALFGPTHPELGFGPAGEKNRVLSLDLPCRPCSLHGDKPCRYPRRFCLDDLTPGQVFAAAADMTGRA